MKRKTGPMGEHTS